MMVRIAECAYQVLCRADHHPNTLFQCRFAVEYSECKGPEILLMCQTRTLLFRRALPGAHHIFHCGHVFIHVIDQGLPHV